MDGKVEHTAADGEAEEATQPTPESGAPSKEVGLCGIETRLTGQHETAPYNEYSYGVSDRGASVRIPWQVEVDQKGYIEDRRPNANMDPYVVTRLIVDTCCSALA